MRQSEAGVCRKEPWDAADLKNMKKSDTGGGGREVGEKRPPVCPAAQRAFAFAKRGVSFLEKKKGVKYF